MMQQMRDIIPYMLTVGMIQLIISFYHDQDNSTSSLGRVAKCYKNKTQTAIDRSSLWAT